jgi:predicted Zn-dependent protease
VSGESDERAEATAEVLEEAASLADEGRWDEARDALRERLEEDPENPELLCWLGIAARELGAEGEAYELFRRALQGEPRDPFVLASIGRGLAAFDDPEAEGALRLAALSAPDFPFARAAYGAYLAREGLWAEATTELEAARGLAPDDAAVRAELGTVYLLARRAEEGIEELEAALSSDPEDAWLRALYGMALLEAGREEEGAEELHSAALERVEDVELQLVYALAAAGEGWDDEAWNALSRAEAAAEEMDAMLLQEVEEAIEAGPEEALDFLRRELLAPTLRERLVQRP